MSIMSSTITHRWPFTLSAPMTALIVSVSFRVGATPVRECEGAREARAILDKLGLEETSNDHQRVLALLTTSGRRSLGLSPQSQKEGRPRLMRASLQRSLTQPSGC